MRRFRHGLALRACFAALMTVVLASCGDDGEGTGGPPLAAEPAPAYPCSQSPTFNNPFNGQTGKVLFFRGPLSDGVWATGACGDAQLLVDVPECEYPFPGCTPVALWPTLFETDTYYSGPPPNTRLRIYKERGFRGAHTDFTGVPNATFDYNGSGSPQLRSLLVLVGTPSSNRSTLISTLSCPRCDLEGADLSGLDLRGANLQDANLTRANLRNTILSGANAARAIFSGATMVGADLSGATLTQATFQSDAVAVPAADLSSANLTGARLDHALLSEVTAESAIFTGAVLNHADFTNADLTRADFESTIANASLPAVFNGAAMAYVSLKNAQLSGSFFRGAVMSPVNLGNADLSGAWMEADSAGDFGRVTLANSYMLNTRLNGAHLTNAVLDGVSWYNTNASAPIATGAGAFLNGASFNLADLPGLDLTGAYLQGASLTNAQLIGANLTNARLDRNGSTACNLASANLAGANLTSAILSYASLQNAKVDPQPASEIYIEVLKDPDRFQKPTEYQYFAVNRPATVLGNGSTVSVVTDSATCPSGARGPCGAITAPAWIAQNPPKEPTDCTPTAYDAEGNVIAVNCSSSRHPT